MRVKVGEQWYDAEPGQPIMVELTKEDRISIGQMSSNMYRYARFHHEDDRTDEQACQWMEV